GCRGIVALIQPPYFVVLVDREAGDFTHHALIHVLFKELHNVARHSLKRSVEQPERRFAPPYHKPFCRQNSLWANRSAVVPDEPEPVNKRGTEVGANVRVHFPENEDL